MQNINARDLCNMEIAHVWAILENEHIVVFEDGHQLQTSKRKTFYSRYFWEIHRAYPLVPLLARHHVEQVLCGKPLSSNTHVDLFSILLKDAVQYHNLYLPQEKEHILGMIYELTNKISNEIPKAAEAHVTSIDILDFIEVVEHPAIKAANESCVADHESITRTYKNGNNAIENDPSLAHNALVRAIKSKMVNANQVAQCVMVRGFVTEVDGAILAVPILSNYTEGMNTLYEYVAESRSAAKSLYFSEAPLQDAEYFARRLQLLTMVVERISYRDCGTQTYLPWSVKPPTFDDRGNKVFPGDLKFLVGKHYLDEETNSLKEISGDETYLHNRLIKMRSVLFCEDPDPHAVCDVCFGGLSRNVSQFQNLGHLCSATMTQQTSQSVLSTKHLDASSVSANITLGEDSRKFFYTNKEKNTYHIRKEAQDLGIRITVPRDAAIGLTDILLIDDVEVLNPIRVSSIELIEVTYMVEGFDLATQIYVSQGKRKAVLTMEFLRYLKTHRWQSDARNNFVFDLIGWDCAKPFLRLPDMEYSYSDQSHQIAKVIESSMKNITDRVSPHSAVSTLQEVYTLVNNKLDVKLSALEVIIYALMVPNSESYAMARGAKTPVLGIADLLIKNRSMGPSYAYEDTHVQITSPRSFFQLDRPSCIMDVFMAPKEVVEEIKARQHN